MSRKPLHTQLDHSGDPEPRDADAPRRMIGGTGRTLLDAMRAADGSGPRAEDRVNDPAELMRRVSAAVACEVARGAHGDSTLRAECEGKLLLDLLGEAKRETGGATTAPRVDRCRMVRLRWAARDWMRAERRKREELASDLPELHTADLAGRPGEHLDRAPEWSPGRAHAGARQLCALLGVRDGGNIETALYAYLRGEDATTADIAAETGLTSGAARNAISNGRALIRAAYPNPADLLAALLLIDRREAGAPASASKRTRAAVKQYRRDSWRDTPDAYPCEVRTRQGRPDAPTVTREEVAHAADETARTYRETHLAALLNVPPTAPNPGLDPSGEFAGTRRDP